MGIGVRLSGEISLCPLTLDRIDLIEKMYEWENDESIRHLHHVTRSAEEFASLHISLDDSVRRVETVSASKRDFLWCLFLADQPVGVLTGSVDPGHLWKKESGTFWPGIFIGESSARGKGIGRQAMLWCEELARELGCKRIELGVFEFNSVARRLYRSLGYAEIARIADFTWWNGRLWGDIRMEKCLQSNLRAHKINFKLLF